MLLGGFGLGGREVICGVNVDVMVTSRASITTVEDASGTKVTIDSGSRVSDKS